MIRPLLVVAVLFASCTIAQTTQPRAAIAELQVYVEDFFAHNYKDITARTTIDWGEAIVDEKGNKSIRYQYEATIWDREKILENKIFTFAADGKFIKVESLAGFPRKLGAVSPATQPVMRQAQSVDDWLKERVEDYFARNYRDITHRSEHVWGEPMIDSEGNLSIRYQCVARIWDKEDKPFDQTFCFTPAGKLVSVK